MPTDQEIIAQQEASLNEPKKVQGTAAEASVTADQSGVTDAGLGGFPTTAGMPQVAVGRTGATGGGTNAQIIPPEEGASQKQGESSAFYDNAQGRGDMQEQVASRNPGSVNVHNDGVENATTARKEPISTNTNPGEPQLIDQNQSPFSA